MKQIGLFFGSFNPIHIGHLALANYMCEFEDIDEVWFVVSPQNPFKDSSELLDTRHRVEMVMLATEHYSKFKVEEIELELPIPSYTIDTLNELQKRYSDCFFNIIMGADNIQSINRWKDADMILSNYCILVYPRIGFDTSDLDLPLSVKITKAPTIEMASTQIRDWIKQGKQLPYFVSHPVFEYIKTQELYK